MDKLANNTIQDGSITSMGVETVNAIRHNRRTKKSVRPRRSQRVDQYAVRNRAWYSSRHFRAS